MNANETLCESRRLVLENTVTERYCVTEKALALVPNGADRDTFLIKLFQQHDGSAYCDELFYNDANPSVGVDIVLAIDEPPRVRRVG
jgi:hypothetical protein